MAKYKTEREGQINFYEWVLPRIDQYKDIKEIISGSNGVFNYGKLS